MRHERTGAWGSIEAYALHMELIRREQGRLDEVQAALDAVLPDMIPPGMQLLRALTAVGRGDLDLADSAPARRPDGVPVDYAWLPYTCALVEVAVALGLPLAAQLYDTLLPYRDEVVVLDGSFVRYGSTEHYLGLLAEHLDRPEAEEHFTAALGVHDHLHAVPWAARTRIGLAGVTGNAGLLDEAAKLVETTQLVVLQQELAT